MSKLATSNDYGGYVMRIETERLLIRKFEPNDLQAVYEYTSDANVMQYIPEGVFTDEAAQQFIPQNMGSEADKFAVVLKGENMLIGHIFFGKYFGEHTYEIGCVVNSKFYNKGYATEAAHAMLQYAFEEMKLHRVIATCQPQNPPSYRVMEKIGMRREGYFKKCIPNGDEWWDEYYYAILGEEWK